MPKCAHIIGSYQFHLCTDTGSRPKTRMEIDNRIVNNVQNNWTRIIQIFRSDCIEILCALWFFGNLCLCFFFPKSEQRTPVERVCIVIIPKMITTKSFAFEIHSNRVLVGTKMEHLNHCCFHRTMTLMLISCDYHVGFYINICNNEIHMKTMRFFDKFWVFWLSFDCKRDFKCVFFDWTCVI